MGDSNTRMVVAQAPDYPGLTPHERRLVEVLAQIVARTCAVPTAAQGRRRRQRKDAA